MAEMTSQERIRLAFAHKEPDRVPIHDTIWEATLARWRDEGMPPFAVPEELFGLEIVGIGADNTAMLPVRVLERTDEYIIETSSDGETRRNHRDRSTTPEIIDCAIKSRADWDAMKPRLQPGYTRVDWISTRARYHKARSDGKFVVYSAITGYDRLQRLLRSEQLLMTMGTDPAWVQEMAETNADLVIENARMLLREGFAFDGAWLYNDMAYRKAPLFSLKMYRRIFKPSEQRIWDFFRTQGIPVILHTDGNIWEMIPEFVGMGLSALQPLEVKAGMDLVRLKQEYGNDLTFIGGIDVRPMYDPDPQAIEREIATKIPVAMKGGGYIYHSDHSIPLNVSYQQYRRVLELVRKYGEY